MKCKKILKKALALALVVSSIIIYNQNIIKATNTPKKGIDVSEHQENIDWQQVKDSGVEFAIIRSSFGSKDWDKQTDKKFRDNVEGAQKVGIKIGAYHYSYAMNVEQANQEADFFLDRIKGIKWDYPVCYDFEDPKQMALSNSERTEIVYTFLSKVENQGYYVALYSFFDWINNSFDMEKLKKFDIWIAQWRNNCTYKGNYGIWQNSDCGKIPGIKRATDTNYSYKDYPEIIKKIQKEKINPLNLLHLKK